MRFRIGHKVGILSSRKTDGRYNSGVIVGARLAHDSSLGFYSERDFVAQYRHPRYIVAFVDCFTQRGQSEEFAEAELCLTKDLPK